MISLNEAMSRYTNAIIEDYNASFDNQQMRERFVDGLEYTVGKKYIKVVKGGSVHSFIVNVDNDKKFAYGDILKPASWATPARNFARGNIFGEYRAQWTSAI